LCGIITRTSIRGAMGALVSRYIDRYFNKQICLDKEWRVWYTSCMIMRKEKDNMNKEQIEDMMITLEQLAGDVRSLTYAIKDLTDVNENLSKIQFLNLPKKQLKDAA